MATEILKKQTIVGTDAQYEANRSTYEEGTVFESTSLLGEGDIDPTYTDKFVQKITGMSGTRAYTCTPSGDGQMVVTADLMNSSIVARDSSGCTSVGTPTSSTHATPKEYVDELVGTKLDKTGGTISGDLVVEQNLTIKGTTTTVDTQKLEVKDNLITVAKDNVAVLTAPAGLHVPKYDGTNDGALVFDSTGTAYVGDVKLDESGNINTSQSDLQPLATRKDLVNGNLVQWDGTNTTLVDSGIQPWEIVKKYTDDYQPHSDQEGVYGYQGVEQRFYEFGIGFSQYGNIPKYVDDGNGLPSIPVVNVVNDEVVGGFAINKAYADANYVPIKPSNFDTTTTYDTEGAYCFTYNATDKTFTPEYKDFGLGSNNLPIYNDDATLTVATPAPGGSGSEQLAGYAASDTYVKENFVLSEFGHTPSQSAQEQLGLGFTKLAYVADFGAAGDNVAIALSESHDNNTIALRTSSGQLSTNEPTEAYHAVNKSYADNRFRYTHLIEVKNNAAPEGYEAYTLIGTITYVSNSATPLTSIDQLPLGVALPIHGKMYIESFEDTYTATRKTISDGTSYLLTTYLKYKDGSAISLDSGNFYPTSFTDTVL